MAGVCFPLFGYGVSGTKKKVAELGSPLEFRLLQSRFDSGGNGLLTTGQFYQIAGVFLRCSTV